MGTHDHEVADPSQSAKDYWEAHYAERERIWSGRVNAHFATVVADLPPGRALDLGCGEGGDAVWLAERGWHVTAVDISDTAMGRAGEEARTRGVSERIEFQRHDLSDSFPEGTYDLVSAQFLHSTVRLERPQVLRHAADAVARGGYLVIVDHGGMPPWATKVPHDHPFPLPRRCSQTSISRRENGTACGSKPSTGRPPDPTARWPRCRTTSWFCGEGADASPTVWALDADVGSVRQRPTHSPRPRSRVR